LPTVSVSRASSSLLSFDSDDDDDDHNYVGSARAQNNVDRAAEVARVRS
jgi:hypothetical protein